MPGQPITRTRLITPIEATRSANCSDSYLPFVREHNSSDKFLFDCIAGGVPLDIGKLMMNSVCDLLEKAAVPYDCGPNCQPRRSRASRAWSTALAVRKAHKDPYDRVVNLLERVASKADAHNLEDSFTPRIHSILADTGASETFITPQLARFMWDTVPSNLTVATASGNVKADVNGKIALYVCNTIAAPGIPLMQNFDMDATIVPKLQTAGKVGKFNDVGLLGLEHVFAKHGFDIIMRNPDNHGKGKCQCCKDGIVFSELRKNVKGKSAIRIPLRYDHISGGWWIDFIPMKNISDRDYAMFTSLVKMELHNTSSNIAKKLQKMDKMLADGSVLEAFQRKGLKPSKMHAVWSYCACARGIESDDNEHMSAALGKAAGRPTTASAKPAQALDDERGKPQTGDCRKRPNPADDISSSDEHDDAALEKLKVPKQAEKMKEVFEVFNARDQHDVSIRGVKAGLRRQKKRMSVDAFHRWFEHMGSCPGCWVCDKLGVMRKISRPIDPHRETRPAHTWHMDTITWSERSVERNKYLTVLRCAACPYYIGIPHGARSDIPDLIEAWILEMRNDPLFKGFQYTVCSLIICDSAGEWTEFSQDNHRAGYGRWDGSKKWQEMRARVGFDCHYTCPDRKEENATAERSCRVIEDKVKASLMAKNLPGSWWQVAARAVIWLLNRFPIISMRENMAIDGDEMRPLEFITMGKYSRRQIDRELSHYVPFGMLCLCHCPEVDGSALKPKCRWGVAHGMYREQVWFLCPFSSSRFRTKSFSPLEAHDSLRGMNAFQILGIEQKEDINYNVQLPGDEIDNENDPLIVQLPPIKDFQLSMVKIPIKPTTMPGPSASDSPSKDGDNKFENDDDYDHETSVSELLAAEDRRAVREGCLEVKESVEPPVQPPPLIVKEAGDERNSDAVADDSGNELGGSDEAVNDKARVRIYNSSNQQLLPDPKDGELLPDPELRLRLKQRAQQELDDAINKSQLNDSDEEPDIKIDEEKMLPAIDIEGMATRDIFDDIDRANTDKKFPPIITKSSFRFSSQIAGKRGHKLPQEQHDVYHKWLLSPAAFDNPFKEADLPKDIGYVKAGLKIPYPAGSVWRRMLRADEAERFKQRYAKHQSKRRRKGGKAKMSIRIPYPAPDPEQLLLDEVRIIVKEHKFARALKAITVIEENAEFYLGKARTARAFKVKKQKSRSTMDQNAEIQAPKNTFAAIYGDYSDEWVESLTAEFERLRDMGVFELGYTLDQLREKGINSKPVPIVTVLTHKFNKDGEIEKRKSRMCVSGDKWHMQKGVHYDETYTAAPNQHTGRLLQALMVRLKWSRLTFDISAAYCHADLPDGKEIILQYPKGFQPTNDKGEKLYMLMKKNLYGHPAAGRQWSITRDKFILKRFNTDGWSATKCKMDPCLFHLRKDGEEMLALIYTDDCDCIGSNQDIMSEFQTILNDKWGIRETDPEFMLGVKRTMSNIGADGKDVAVELTMTEYVQSMVKEFEADITALPKRHREIPIPPGVVVSLSPNTTVTEENKDYLERGYNRACGMVMWAARHCYPQCLYGISQCCRVMARPTEKEWTYILQIMSYMSQHATQGVRFTSEHDGYGYSFPVILSDSSNKVDVYSSRAQHGHVLKFAGGPVACLSKRHTHFGRSAAHHEYMGLLHASATAIWALQLFDELKMPGFLNNHPLPMLGDNKAANTLTLEDLVTGGNQYILMAYHGIKEYTAEGYVRVFWIAGTENEADLMTKAVSKETLLNLVDRLTGYEYYDYEPWVQWNNSDMQWTL